MLRTLWLMLFCLMAVGCTPPINGTWTGSLPIGATSQRDFTFQLHQRADDEVIGYVLGGTSFRTLVTGSLAADQLTLSFELRDSVLARNISVTGTISGDTYTGVATELGVDTAIVWNRQTGIYHERRFIVAESTDGDGFTEVAVVLDELGNFVSGGFVGAENCDLIACGGGLTSFIETPSGDITIGLETGGGCQGVGTINANFDAMSKFYSGNYTYQNSGACAGPVINGPLIGVRDMGSQSDHADSMLGAFAGLADNLETGVSLASPHASIASSYLHFGNTETNLLTQLNAEVMDYTSIQAEFTQFASLRTVDPGDLSGFFPSTPRVSFKDVRRGIPLGEIAPVVYREVDPNTPQHTELYYLGEQAGNWLIYGNQVGEFDLPFPYSLGAEKLIVPAGSGATAGNLHLSLGGWGAHFGPLTGHLEGNGKADMFAHYAQSVSDMTELINAAGGTPGSCDANLPGEVCGFFGGLSGEIIRDRVFKYYAPYNGTVQRVIYEERPRPLAAPETHYFDNVPHWSVDIAFDGNLTIRFVHLGRITGAVRAGMIANLGIDPDTYVPSAIPGDPEYCPPSPGRCDVDLVNGASFSILAGEEIAAVQTDAAPIPGFPGFYRGQIGPSISPWGQVEYFMSESLGSHSASVCTYAYLPEVKRDDMAAMMTADMNNPLSLRYGENDFTRAWKYAAEAELCNNNGYFFRNQGDFSSIHAQLGGWYERSEAGTTADEHFTIAKVHKDAGAYDASLYDFILGTTDKVDYLVSRQRTDGASYSWDLPGGGSVDVWYPTAEVLQLTANSMVLKWRELGHVLPGTVLYQRAAFEIDASTGQKIKWGNYANTLVTAVAPTLLPGEACNDTTVMCYGHQRP